MEQTLYTSDTVQIAVNNDITGGITGGVAETTATKSQKGRQHSSV